MEIQQGSDNKIFTKIAKILIFYICAINLSGIPSFGVVSNNSTITFSFPERGHYSVWVLDSSNNIKNTLLDNQLLLTNSTPKQVTWDGKDSSGNYVPNGAYTIKIRGTDGAQNSSEVTTPITISGL
jgi:hypothetical protein